MYVRYNGLFVPSSKYRSIHCGSNIKLSYFSLRLTIFSKINFLVGLLKNVLPSLAFVICLLDTRCSLECNSQVQRRCTFVFNTFWFPLMGLMFRTSGKQASISFRLFDFDLASAYRSFLALFCALRPLILGLSLYVLYKIQDKSSSSVSPATCRIYTS
ncbi:hypothetical protein BDP27DRAFT_508334 [Rhodocollybia butyracea]|uniref:Uncharacterized protein n=1 Tax=Rhodocollybia butyracea TaxID=206335 RepID=A0A9P5TXD1_9AGAR|nr:hypothetical protein BDP27DRAFT_508334 [Rhodocollybia butyracea]